LLYRPQGKGPLLPEVVRLDHDFEEAFELRMSISQFIHDLYHGRIEEEWAGPLQKAIWRDGGAPFFSPWPRAG
jgi:hypothetical protein